MRQRFLRLTGIALLTVLLVAGCSGDADNESAPDETRSDATQASTQEPGGTRTASDPARVLADARSRTLDAGSSRVALRLEYDNPMDPRDWDYQGEFDFRNTKGRLTYKAVRTAQADGTPVLMEEGQYLIDGDTWYSPVASIDYAKIPENPTWSTVRVRDLWKSLGYREATDPTSVLQLLHGVTGDITTAGTEELRGTRTTHYKVTIDLRKAGEGEAPESQKASLRELIQMSRSATVPADVWIDDDGRVRRLRYEWPFKGEEPSPEGGQVTVDVELFDFGTPIKLTLPPASEVIEASEMHRILADLAAESIRNQR